MLFFPVLQNGYMNKVNDRYYRIPPFLFLNYFLFIEERNIFYIFIIIFS